MGRLDGKIAFITGTAGGQGRAAALLFAGEGAYVVGCDVKEASAAETAEMVRARGGRMVSAAPVDLTDPVQVAHWLDRGLSAAGGIDILYNNAAAMRQGTVTSTSAEEWTFTLKHELDIVYTVTRAAWPHLVARGGGVILNTASSVAHRGSAGNLAHGAAKGAVVALTRHLAAEGLPHRIRCNSISPGAVETPALADMLAQLRAQGLSPSIPLGRIGQPEDIAYCALYLASDEASWVTAADFVVDGGVAGLRNARSAVASTD